MTKQNVLHKALVAMENMQQKIDAVQKARREPIAIIGMACRFPGAPNPDAFWELLKDGENAICNVPEDRWSTDQFFDSNPDKPGKVYIKAAGFLDEVDGFDARFFGVSSREATGMDPQQRLLLEVAWEALEHAGQAPMDLNGSATGVFVGIGLDDYKQYSLRTGSHDQIDAYTGTGALFCVASGRISYTLGLQGPNLATDTACSSSLVSLHLACNSLRSGECDMALAGGVHLMLAPEMTVFLCRMKALSPDSQCRTFDASANGYVRGEGCGMLALKRLSTAQEDGDPIHALIRGSAINHDGHTSGLTVPNQQSQERLIRAALKNAEIEPRQVDYIEAHGTGTPLGDPIEVKALGSVFTNRKKNLLLGSVKTNIGHLEAGAGVAGVMKVILSLKHGELPASLNFKTPNPIIPWNELPLNVMDKHGSWIPNGETRIAGVSSFGISGTNAFVLLEEAPTAKQEAVADSKQLLCLSARNETALQELVDQYKALLTSSNKPDWADICYTACAGRSHFEHRLALTAENAAEAAGILTGEEGRPDKGICEPGKRPKIAFFFTGQGSQYPGMARELYQNEPLFRQVLDQCNSILLPKLQTPLLSVIYPADGESPIHETAYTQPALFAIEYALAQLWMSWGVKPNYLLGHSVGEYVAACLAGVFSLEEGLNLIAERGRLMQSLPRGGGMAAVVAREQDIRSLLEPYSNKVSIAAINGPNDLVLSGEEGLLEDLRVKLKEEGVKSIGLKVSHAFHSALMDPILSEFETFASNIEFKPAQLNLISNLKGKLVGNEILDAAYWREHLRSPVLFKESLTTLDQMGVDICLESGPKPTLLGLARKTLPDFKGALIPSLRTGKDDREQMLRSLGACYACGVEVDFRAFYKNRPARKVSLPTYPFQREKYWAPKAKISDQAVPGSGGHHFLGRRLRSPMLKSIVYEKTFSAQVMPYLEDHQLHNVTVVPGACHLTMVLSAARESLSLNGARLTSVSFSQALVIEENSMRTVQLILEPKDENHYTFRLFSSLPDEEDPQWVEHATGLLSREKPQANSLKGEPRTIQGRCKQTLAGSDFYEEFSQIGYQLGPAFRWMKDIYIGDGEALAEMKTPAEVLNPQNFQLFPGLADACFQLSVLALPGEGLETIAKSGDIYVPFSVEDYRFHGQPQGDSLWCHVWREGDNSGNELFSGDLNLYDQNGDLLVEVKGLRIKRAPQKALFRQASSPVHRLDVIQWKPFTPTEGEPGAWLTIGPKTEFTKQLSEIVIEKGGLLAHIEAKPPYSKEAWSKLLDDNPGNWTDIVYFCFHDPVSFEEMDWDDAQRWASDGCWSVTTLVQALNERAIKRSPRIHLVTRGAQDTGRMDLISPHQSTLWGLGRVIASEHSNLWGSLIDLDPQGEPDAAKLYKAVSATEEEDQICLRADQCLSARMQPAEISTKSLKILGEGTYLVTGGLGGLGLKVTEMLASKGAGRIVLTARRPPDVQTKAFLRKLEKKGADIMVEGVDVSDVKKMASLFKSLTRFGPPLKGVIHTAGVIDDGLIAHQTLERLNTVMTPKVSGSWNLHQLCRNEKLDFFILFSAAAGVLGNPGQANYSAANNFLDALAHYRRNRGLPAVSIDWGAWAEAGMAARMSDQNRKRLADQGMGEMEIKWGLAAMDQAANGDHAQVTALSIDWGLYMKKASSPFPSGPSLFRELSDAKPQPTNLSVDTSSDLADRLNSADPTEKRPLLLTEIANMASALLGLGSSQKVRPAERLFEAGLDSLMAVELRNSLQSALNLTLPATLLFDYPTVEALAGFIAEELEEEMEGAEPVVETEARLKPATADASESLDDKSDEELASLLDEELETVDQYLED